MKCENKRKQQSEQNPIIGRASLYVTPNNKYSVRTRVRTCYYYKQNKLLLYPKQDITIARITYYYSHNNFSSRTNKIKCQNK
jgi:hypothetical protein